MRRSTSSKGGSAAVVANLSQNDDSKVEVGAEYTKRDVKALEADELELIVRLLKLKGDALTRLHGAAGFRMSAKINIDALKIYENCPAASKMKDLAIIFPVYNLGILAKASPETIIGSVQSTMLIDVP